MFFVWSKCVNARILLYEVFDEIYYYGVSDKIIATMNKMIKAIIDLVMR